MTVLVVDLLERVEVEDDELDRSGLSTRQGEAHPLEEEPAIGQPGERIALAGTANLTRSALDFPNTLRPVLEALEEQVVLLKLIGEVNDPTTVHVKIGEENNVEGLRSTSVVTVGYGPEQGAYAGMGVVGPTRMDYAGSIGSVRAVARYVGELLAGA